MIFFDTNILTMNIKLKEITCDMVDPTMSQQFSNPLSKFRYMYIANFCSSTAVF